MMTKKIYVVTGGPGFGKTQLIDELRQSGYNCSGEFARDLIENQVQIGGNILPWKNAKLFQEEVLRKRITFFESVPEQTMAIADRAIPDQLAFAQYKGFGIPEILLESSTNYRYAPEVFVTPPWPEIFRNDKTRTETFEEAVCIHEFILKTYSDLNYKIIELPLVPVIQRKEYLLQTIQNSKKNDYQPT
jgi:predicted ATPase